MENGEYLYDLQLLGCDFQLLKALKFLPTGGIGRDICGEDPALSDLYVGTFAIFVQAHLWRVQAIVISVGESPYCSRFPKGQCNR